MELEHVRRVLAEKAMGWHEEEIEIAPDVRGTYWMDANKRGMIHVRQWCPWDSWEQTGKVIEALREKGWRFTITSADERWTAWMWKRYKPWELRRVGKGETFPAAVSLAAARALEAADGT